MSVRWWTSIEGVDREEGHHGGPYSVGGALAGIPRSTALGSRLLFWYHYIVGAMLHNVLGVSYKNTRSVYSSETVGYSDERYFIGADRCVLDSSKAQFDGQTKTQTRKLFVPD